MRFHQKIAELFGIDIRSLAVMRVGVALVVLVDLWIRSYSIDAHYGVGSIFPPELVFAGEWYSTWPSLFELVAALPSLPYFIFAGTALCAVFLLAGWHTRIASIGTWAGMLMVHTLNPLVLQGGDILIRLVLLLGIFLPWARAYSVDRSLALRDEDEGWVALSPWTAAYLVQISFVYFFAALEKSSAEWTSEGSAVYYALSIDQFSTPVGEWLLGFPVLLMALTFGVHVLQKASLFMLFSPVATFACRSLAIALLMGMHVSFGLCMNLGPFSWISVIALFGFVPTRFWTWLSAMHRRVWGSLAIYYDGDCGFCKKSVYLIRDLLLIPATSIQSAQTAPSIRADMVREDSWVIVTPSGSRHFGFDAGIEIARRSPLVWWVVPLARLPLARAIGERVYRFVAAHRSRICTVEPAPRFSLPTPLRRALGLFSACAAIAYVTLVFAWNYNNRYPTPVIGDFFAQYGGLMRSSGIDQWWNMFSPYPSKDDGWYHVEGITHDGRSVNAFDRTVPLAAEKPLNVSALYPDERWRKYLMNLTHVNYARYRKYYAAYLCSAHPDLARVTITFFFEHTAPEYAQPELRHELLEWKECETGGT